MLLVIRYTFPCHNYHPGVTILLLMFALNQYFCELRRILVWRGSGHVELVVNIDKLTGNSLLPLTKGELTHSPLFRLHIYGYMR